MSGPAVRCAEPAAGRQARPAGRVALGVMMIALPLFLSCASGAGRSGAPAPLPPLAQEPILLPVPADPSVVLSLGFAVGSQDDPAGKEGLAYLTATLMAEGATQVRSYPDILTALYPMAAGYRVRVDRERTTFTGRVHRDNLDAFTGLLLDAVRRPAFAAADLERIRQRTVDALEKTLRYASDEELGKAALYGEVFHGTPYGHLERGTVAGLAAISIEDVRGFYRTHFTRDTVLLGLGGGYPPALAERMRAELAALPAGVPAPAADSRPAAIGGRRVVIVSKPGQATAISLGFPIAARRGEREFYALWLANSWLGEHRSSASHLYQVIREARGMNYGDYSYIEAFPDGGRRDFPPTGVPRRHQLFEVWVRPVPNAQAHFALRAAIREIERLVRGGLEPEQHELTRAFLSKYILHFAETTADRLGYLVDDRFFGIPPPGHLERFAAVLPTLTREEVNAAVRTILQPDNMVISMVSGDAKALARALVEDRASPISYTTPKPAAVLAEDRSIEVYPLHVPAGAVRVVPVEQMFAR